MVPELPEEDAGVLELPLDALVVVVFGVVLAFWQAPESVISWPPLMTTQYGAFVC